MIAYKEQDKKKIGQNESGGAPNNSASSLLNKIAAGALNKSAESISPSQAAQTIKTARESLAGGNLEKAAAELKLLMEACRSNGAQTSLLGGEAASELRLLQKEVQTAIKSIENWLSSLSPLGVGDDPNWHFNEDARLGGLQAINNLLRELNPA